MTPLLHKYLNYKSNTLQEKKIDKNLEIISLAKKLEKVTSFDVKLATADLTNFFVVIPLLHTYYLNYISNKYKIRK